MGGCECEIVQGRPERVSQVQGSSIRRALPLPLVASSPRALLHPASGPAVSLRRGDREPGGLVCLSAGTRTERPSTETSLLTFPLWIAFLILSFSSPLSVLLEGMAALGLRW